jgi:ribosome-interacting GTPase 1
MTMLYSVYIPAIYVLNKIDQISIEVSYCISCILDVR